jgi:hypothetical protein
MAAVIILSDTKLDLDATSQIASSDPALLQMLLAGIAPVSQNTTLRYNCFRVLMRLAASHPFLLMPYWDFFVDELHDTRADQQYIGIRLIAELIPLDTAHRFDSIMDLYFGMLTTSGLINANQVAGVAGNIVLARPDLEQMITNILLAIQNPRLDDIRIGLVKSYAIESISQYFEKIEDPAPIFEFVLELLESPSPRARKAAASFIKKHSKNKTGV